MQKLDDLEEENPVSELISEETITEEVEEKPLKEYQKLLFADTQRKEFYKAIDEVKLGLFTQKEETTFDFSNYTLMTYQKKYKGLYDLYQHNETMELVFVCPLIENNKGDEHERKDLRPYAYDVLYLEYLDAEAYDLVKKAAIHENSKGIDCLYYSSIALYFAFLLFNLITVVITVTVLKQTNQVNLPTMVSVCGSLWVGQLLMTLVLPILMIQYRKYKAR